MVMGRPPAAYVVWATVQGLTVHLQLMTEVAKSRQCTFWSAGGTTGVHDEGGGVWRLWRKGLSGCAGTGSPLVVSQRSSISAE